jgi:hypothetical protein
MTYYYSDYNLTADNTNSYGKDQSVSVNCGLTSIAECPLYNL